MELECEGAFVRQAFTPLNYKQRMHSLLRLEEVAQSTCLGRCARHVMMCKKWRMTISIFYFTDFSTNLVAASIALSKTFWTSTLNSSTYKCASEGELFGELKMTSEVSEDTPQGRLIVQNVSHVLVAPARSADDTPVSQVGLHKL